MESLLKCQEKGDYITVEDLLDEVGKDASRFIMLSRSSDVELDFDFTKVKEKSKDNPFIMSNIAILELHRFLEM